MITYEEFEKIELKVAKIIEAKNVEGSLKLIKIIIDLGGEKRQIVSGIGKFYTSQELVGREVVIVVNLEPRKIMGLESQGMLLATDGNPILIVPDKEVLPGTKIR